LVPFAETPIQLYFAASSDKTRDRAVRWHRAARNTYAWAEFIALAVWADVMRGVRCLVVEVDFLVSFFYPDPAVMPPRAPIPTTYRENVERVRALLHKRWSTTPIEVWRFGRLLYWFFHGERVPTRASVYAVTRGGYKPRAWGHTVGWRVNQSVSASAVGRHLPMGLREFRYWLRLSNLVALWPLGSIIVRESRDWYLDRESMGFAILRRWRHLGRVRWPRGVSFLSLDYLDHYLMTYTRRERADAYWGAWLELFFWNPWWEKSYRRFYVIARRRWGARW
jgi:hypothetical protein